MEELGSTSLIESSQHCKVSDGAGCSKDELAFIAKWAGKEDIGAQLAKLRNSARVGVLVVSFLHFKFKWNKALLHNACSSLVELIFHPLVQLHLLGQTVKRPFGGGGGAGLDPAMMAKMMGGGGLAPPGGAAK